MIIEESSRASGLLLAAMTLWTIAAFGSVRVCPVHDAPDGAVVSASRHSHGDAASDPMDEQDPADDHGGHDCQCAGHCCPASGVSVSTGGPGLSLALFSTRLITVPPGYAQPAPASHPWLFPPANGPPAV